VEIQDGGTVQLSRDCGWRESYFTSEDKEAICRRRENREKDTGQLRQKNIQVSNPVIADGTILLHWGQWKSLTPYVAGGEARSIVSAAAAQHPLEPERAFSALTFKLSAIQFTSRIKNLVSEVAKCERSSFYIATQRRRIDCAQKMARLTGSIGHARGDYAWASSSSRSTRFLWGRKTYDPGSAFKKEGKRPRHG